MMLLTWMKMRETQSHFIPSTFMSSSRHLTILSSFVSPSGYLIASSTFLSPSHHLTVLTRDRQKLKAEIIQIKADLGVANTSTNTDFSWLNKLLVRSTLVPSCRKILHSFSQWMDSFSSPLLALQHLFPIYKDKKLILKISLTVSSFSFQRVAWQQWLKQSCLLQHKNKL